MSRLMMVTVMTWLVFNAQTVFAQKAKKSEDVVKVQTKVDKPNAQGLQIVTISMKIEKPWHLYANPVGVEELAATQTVITITGAGASEVVKIEYPKGKLVQDATIGDYFIYEGDANIKATIMRPVGSKKPVEAIIKLQACSDSTCLPPGTLKVKILD